MVGKQPSSSEASPQSSKPSHRHQKGMQWLFEHRNMRAVQFMFGDGKIGPIVGGGVEGAMVVQLISSDPSVQSDSPSHFQDLEANNLIMYYQQTIH